MTVVDEQTAVAQVRAHRDAGRRVVFTNGAFDLLHVGHVRALSDAASHGEVLVVGINADSSVRASRGAGRPIVPAAERAEIVAALGCVDLVFVFQEPTVDAVLERLHPHVHAKGRDYARNTLPERETNERLGIEMVFVGDEKSHAASDLIERAGAAGAMHDRVAAVEDPDVRGFVLIARRSALVRDRLLSLERLATGKLGEYVEGPPHRFIRRLDCEGTYAYLKITKPLSRGRSPIIEFQHHLALRAAGLRAPEPWLCLEGDADGTRCGALLTRTAPGHPLDVFAREETDATARRRAADDVGRAVRGLHTARFLHPDLQAWHLHITEPGGGLRSVWFLDLMRVTRAGRRVPQGPAARGLAALMISIERHTTARERLRGLRAYLGGTLRAGRTWLRAIDRQAEKLRTKSTFRAAQVS